MVGNAPLLPKFVSEIAAMYYELRKRGTTAQRHPREPLHKPTNWVWEANHLVAQGLLR